MSLRNLEIDGFKATLIERLPEANIGMVVIDSELNAISYEKLLSILQKLIFRFYEIERDLRAEMAIDRRVANKETEREYE